MYKVEFMVLHYFWEKIKRNRTGGYGPKHNMSVVVLCWSNGSGSLAVWDGDSSSKGWHMWIYGGPSSPSKVTY